QHLRSFGRQRLQMYARALVAAVLGPHDRKNAELGQIRLAAEKLHDAAVFVRFQSVTFEHLRVDHRRSPERLTLRSAAAPAAWSARFSADRNMPTIDSKMARPSTPPTSASHARS